MARVSPDGTWVVFVPVTDTASLGVWIARIDGSSAPTRLSSSEGLQAFFGAGRDVFFAAQEKQGTFVYRVQGDGTGLQRVLPTPVLFLYSISPDGKYLAAWVSGSGGDDLNSVRLYPVDGGTPITICRGCGRRLAILLPFS